MLFYVLLALVNGMVIATTRTINGRLSGEVGPLRASFWNHLVGFAFLTLALFVVGEWASGSSSAPPIAYLGGFFGALFVAVSSHAFVKLGAMNASLLVISGQMIAAVLLDFVNRGVAPTSLRWLGVAIVLLGVYLSRLTHSTREDTAR